MKPKQCFSLISTFLKLSIQWLFFQISLKRSLYPFSSEHASCKDEQPWCHLRALQNADYQARCCHFYRLEAALQVINFLLDASLGYNFFDLPLTDPALSFFPMLSFWTAEYQPSYEISTFHITRSIDI